MESSYCKNSGAESTNYKTITTDLTEEDFNFRKKEENIPEDWYRVRTIAKLLGYSYSHMRYLISDLVESNKLEKRIYLSKINSESHHSPYYNLSKVKELLNIKD